MTSRPLRFDAPHVPHAPRGNRPPAWLALAAGLIGSAACSAGYQPSTSSHSAATDWLQTDTPLAQGGQQLTIDFAIRDSKDSYLDSTVPIDELELELDETPTQTVPIPDPT